MLVLFSCEKRPGNGGAFEVVEEVLCGPLTRGVIKSRYLDILTVCEDFDQIQQLQKASLTPKFLYLIPQVKKGENRGMLYWPPEGTKEVLTGYFATIEIVPAKNAVGDAKPKE